MSESRFIWECARKRKFTTEKKAKEKLIMGETNGHYEKDKYHIYPCTFCLGYHIGRLKT